MGRLLLMCLWSLLDCKHPYKHKVHIMGDPWPESPSPPMVRARRNGKGYRGKRTQPRALKDKYSLWSWVQGLGS